MLRNPFGERERMVRLKKKGKQMSVTEGLGERREQRGGDAEGGKPRQRTEEAEAHFLGAVAPIQAASLDATRKQQNRFISTLSLMTSKRQEGEKNEPRSPMQMRSI